ncbi:MAG: hypothetical protein DRP89_04290 [Candidatus Neomarinimicrobiota bacterium]|nr:MAG: hypothetical protein DRP89_04290 [Candidatus Neomarinimicrobiota bacterium]
MINSRINKILHWMREVEVGSGDLTTESISPYALHTTGRLIAKSDGIFSGREVLESLFEPIGNQLKVNWNVEESSEIKNGSEILSFEGNGAEVLKVRRLIEWIVGRMSGIATATKETVNFLEKHGKRLVAGSKVSPIFEVFDHIAFVTGGGIFKHHGLEDTIYITHNHLLYAGGISDVLARVEEELGDARKSLKIEIEVNNFDQFVEANKHNCDIIHLVSMDDKQIKEVFEKGDPNKKPILHLNVLSDWRDMYADYFFRFCAIEELFRDVKYFKSKLLIVENGGKYEED